MVDFPVVDLPDAPHVEVGATAPDFTRPLVNDEYWESTPLSDLASPVCLVFYPMDGAFPATYIWNEIRDREWGEHATVVGVSVSDPYAHKRLIEEREMDYRLFSDPGNGVAEAYGVENDLDGMTGIEEARPAVFLLDDELTVEYAWVAEQWPDFPDYDDVERHLERL